MFRPEWPPENYLQFYNYKIHAYCNNFIAQLFQKSQKTVICILQHAPVVPGNPPFNEEKNPNDTLFQEKIPYNLMKKLSL